MYASDPPPGKQNYHSDHPFPRGKIPEPLTCTYMYKKFMIDRSDFCQFDILSKAFWIV